MVQSKPLSDWRADVDDQDRKFRKVRHYDDLDLPELMPDHKISEMFMAQHKLEAAVTLQWNIDDIDEYRGVYALSQVDDFCKIQSILASAESPLHDLFVTPDAVHIDSFTIEFTDSTGMRLASNNQGDPHDARQRFWELNSPETFNAFMKAVAARISVGPFPCACQQPWCRETKIGSKIKLKLSRINEQDGRRVADNKKIPADTKNLVIIGPRIVPRKTKKTNNVKSQQPPKLMIRAACLRRLASTLERVAPDDVVDAESDESLLTEIDETLFDSPGYSRFMFSRTSQLLPDTSTGAPQPTIDEVIDVSDDDDDDDDDDDNDDDMIVDEPI